MADVTGPISSLPGAFHKVPEGVTCDEHPERPAIRRIQGETDSFGSEMIDMCAECCRIFDHAKMEAEKAPPSSACQWCGVLSLTRPHRDWEEGSTGPVYSLCPDCIRKNRVQEREAFEPDDQLFDDFGPSRY